MATVARRTPSPVAEMLEWLGSSSPFHTPFDVQQRGLAPFVRVEDYIEDDSYVLRAELPGIDPEQDVEVTVEHDMLTISGERREETKDKNHREFHYGAFKQAGAAGGCEDGRDHASYDNGVLLVRVPLGTEEAPASRSRSNAPSEETAVHAAVGDRLIVRGTHVDDSERDGEILEVRGEGGTHRSSSAGPTPGTRLVFPVLTRPSGPPGIRTSPARRGEPRSPPMSLTAAGLSTEEAERRSATEGPNRLPRPPRPAPLRQLARQFTHLLAVLLWVAAGLALLAGLRRWRWRSSRWWC